MSLDALPPEIVQLLAHPMPPLWRLAAGAVASMGAAGLAIAGVPLLAARILPSPKDYRLADYLPFAELLPDRRTIRCRGGTLIRCYELRGIDLASVSGNRRKAMHVARKAWLDRMPGNAVDMTCYTVRDRIDAAAPNPPDHPLLARISVLHARNLGAIFRNRQIIVLAARGAKAAANLDHAHDVMAATLADYAPAPMIDNPANAGAGPLAFLARLASPATRPAPHAAPVVSNEIPINEVIAADTIGFKGAAITFTGGGRTLHAAVIGIRKLADVTDDAIVDEIAALPAELVICTAIRPLTQIRAIGALAHRARLAKVGRIGSGADKYFAEAVELIEGQDEDHQTAHYVSQTVVLYADSEQELEDIVRELVKQATARGLTPVREVRAAQPAWFAQFPEYDNYPRSYMLYSANVASMATFNKTVEGAENNDWGRGPIVNFRTSTGDAYRFHLHVRDDVSDAVAHAVVIGPTGSGKSTFMQFVAACAHRYPHLRSYFFDRFNGVEIFSRALGPDYARYIAFDGGADSAAMNPLQIEDTADNRSFLKLWFQTITNCTDERAVAEITRAVDGAFAFMPRAERTMEALHQTGFSPHSPIRRELRRWLKGGQYGGIFDAPRDSIDLGLRHVAFDFTRILEDNVLAPAVLHYLMHRIRATIVETGSSALIFIDETEPMLRNETFKTKVVKPMLQEFRKLRSAVVLCFQRPGVVDELGIGDVVRGQCQTAFFFRNPQAEEKDYDGWQLTDAEWNFVRGTRARHLPHAVLMKRAALGESVVLDTSLLGLGADLKLFRSSSRDVRKVRSLIQQHGPIDWIKPYLQAADQSA